MTRKHKKAKWMPSRGNFFGVPWRFREELSIWSDADHPFTFPKFFAVSAELPLSLFIADLVPT